MQGRKWLPNTGWASSNVARVPPPGGAFYSTKIWVGNCPSCRPATFLSTYLKNMIILAKLWFKYVKLNTKGEILLTQKTLDYWTIKKALINAKNVIQYILELWIIYNSTILTNILFVTSIHQFIFTNPRIFFLQNLVLWFQSRKRISKYIFR